MSRYVEPSTVREELGEGDWVEIRAGILWVQLMDLIDDAAGEDNRRRTRPTVEGLIRIGVVAWGGPGFENLPIEPETIRRLKLADAARLALLVQKHNPDLVTTDPKAEAAASVGTPSSKAGGPA